MKSTLTFLMSVVAVAVMFTPAMAQQQVTFTKDVAPILQQHCQACHREGTSRRSSSSIARPVTAKARLRRCRC